MIETKAATDRLKELSPLQKAALAIKELRARLDSVEGAQLEPIALIGMGCRFPQADGLEAYWKLLAEGRDAISEVPVARWDLQDFFDANPNAAGKINTRYGGFIDGVDGFDAEFFGISPHEAERMDPQQRILLEVAWHALEDAGIPPASLRGSRTGVFVGITQMDYGVMQLGGELEDIQAYTGTGNGLCFASGRLAYALGLHGPTFSIDTACSSSMVALHQACQALRNRECDVALVAGAQLNLTPPMQVFLSKTQSFSPDGRCRTFDEAANGFVLGEGVGVVVLRRLSDAKTSGDQIRAVIRATGVNHDGPASGLTVPSETAQESLMRGVYERAGIAPGDIDYVEAHGTATQLGDPIEVGALRSVFGERAPEQALLLGSVKTNFGHLNAAAGVAGLIKVALMMEHEQVAPNLHFEQASSRIPWEGFTVRVPTELHSWSRHTRVRRAGISSFGLSGTNTHTVLEEAPLSVNSALDQVALTDQLQRPLHLLCLSARNEKSLRELALAYLDSAALRDDTSLADICFSANTGRNHFASRLVLLLSLKEELSERLQTYTSQGSGSGIWTGQLAKGGAGRMAMLFTASVAIHEVQLLAKTQARVADALLRCERAFVASPKQASLFAETEGQVNVAAQFACQFALAELWISWGQGPSAVAGCGIGALTALCIAGVLDVEQVYLALAGKVVDGHTPSIPVYSGVDGSLHPFTPSLAFRLPPIDESNTSIAGQALENAGFKILLGIGNHSEALSLQSSRVVGLLGDIPNVDLWPSLLETLAKLYLQGCVVDWLAYDAAYNRRRVRLPSYAFQRQRFWLERAKASSPKALTHPTSSEKIAEAAEKPAAASQITEEPSVPNEEDLSRLLGAQLESASAAINNVVAQQLDFLRNRMAASTLASTPTVAVQKTADSAEHADDKLIQAAIKQPDFLPCEIGDWYLLLLAAKNDAELEILVDTLAKEVKSPDHTANTRHASELDGIVGAGPVRSMLVHRGEDDALLALGKGDGKRDLKRLISATVQQDRAVVFMFPGVGDHYLRMAQGLYVNEPTFRSTVDSCCEYLIPSLGIDLREVLYPAQPEAVAEDAQSKPTKKIDMRAMLGRGAAVSDPAEIRLNQTVHSQPLVFIVEYALGQMWLARGVLPQAMIGYSIGEYAAACLAGVIALEDALSLITRRAQMIQALPTGVMLAVPLAEKKLLPLLGKNLSLAIVSTPSLCVVGGEESDICALEERLRGDEVVSRRLPGTHAFHSHMLEPLHQSLVELVQGFTLHPPRIPYISNLTGDWISDADATDPVYWARHTWQTVRFADGMEKLLHTEGRVFMEVGPGQSLGSFVLQHPAAQKLRDKTVLPSLRNRYEKQADEAFLLSTLGKLWLTDIKFELNK